MIICVSLRRAPYLLHWKPQMLKYFFAQMHIFQKKNPCIKQGNFVGTTGFEPATTRPPDVCATGLRYVPKPVAKVTAKINISKTVYQSSASV